MGVSNVAKGQLKLNVQFLVQVWLTCWYTYPELE